MKGDLASATMGVGVGEGPGPASKQFSREELRQLFTLSVPESGCETKDLLDSHPAGGTQVKGTGYCIESCAVIVTLLSRPYFLVTSSSLSLSLSHTHTHSHSHTHKH
jgi:hypothetical protein